MTVGYVNPLTVRDYSMYGGGEPVFKYDVYKGRPKYSGGDSRGRVGKRQGWIRKRGGVSRYNLRPGKHIDYSELNTIRGRNFLRLLSTWGPKILNFFKSAGVRKVASAVGTAGASAAINTALDKLTTKKQTPLKTIAKRRGKEAAVEILKTAKEEIPGSGRGRKHIKRLTKGRRKTKSRKRDIFD